MLNPSIMGFTKESLFTTYHATRQQTVQLCMPLQNEDYVIQGIADVSPPKWHLAHTTWFFETFILMRQKKYELFHPLFHQLFNSYYHTLGNPYPRDRRGLLARPTVETIYAYRKYVDQAMQDYLNALSDIDLQVIAHLVTLGIHHEQQHQELLLMDIKYNFSLDPHLPIYTELKKTLPAADYSPLKFFVVEGGAIEIGHRGNEFCFDNELPLHSYILKPYKIATRLITNGEYLEFIEDGGYKQPRWWLADGWECISKNQWQSPLYWQKDNAKWKTFTLRGLQSLNPAEPVAHISFYEADAYARWRQCRLPTEAEWEHYAMLASNHAEQGNFLESYFFHPQFNAGRHQQLFGDVWEWTASAYQAYPGFKLSNDSLGEYNGKFMSNQMVLRGGSCITPGSHIRTSYRNFYQPDKRWQFSGIRLAKDCEKENT